MSLTVHQFTRTGDAPASPPSLLEAGWETVRQASSEGWVDVEPLSELEPEKFSECFLTVQALACSRLESFVKTWDRIFISMHSLHRVWRRRKAQINRNKGLCRRLQQIGYVMRKLNPPTSLCSYHSIFFTFHFLILLSFRAKDRK